MKLNIKFTNAGKNDLIIRNVKIYNVVVPLFRTG